MRILHAKDEATGAPIENAFVAMEGYDTVLGECQVEARSYPALLPERPHIVDIAAKGSSEALDVLYGAGTALAQLLSRRSRRIAKSASSAARRSASDCARWATASATRWCACAANTGPAP